ncbi:hypothetical protein CCACVL1_06023, partial [Corchorus capsularis]
MANGNGGQLANGNLALAAVSLLAMQ